MNEKCINAYHADQKTQTIIKSLNSDAVFEVGQLATIRQEEMPAITCEMKLPSAEEYAQKDAEYQQHYWEWSTRGWSQPLYICPKCKEGGMCRDETIVLTSIPPKHMYECNKCHHVEYHSI